jgi:hypothetical protein
LARPRRINRGEGKLSSVSRSHRPKDIGKWNRHRRVSGSVSIDLAELTNLLSACANETDVKDLRVKWMGSAKHNEENSIEHK